MRSTVHVEPITTNMSTNILNTPIRMLKDYKLLASNALLSSASKRNLLSQPGNCSLAEIGLTHLLTNPSSDMTYFESKRFMHPLLRFILTFVGHHKVTWYFCIIANFCDFLYAFICFYSFGSGIYAIMMCILAVFNCIFYPLITKGEIAVSERIIANVPNARELAMRENNQHGPLLNTLVYLSLQGFEAISSSDGSNGTSKDALEIMNKRKQIVNSSITEAIVVHGLMPVCTYLWCLTVNLLTHLENNDLPLALLILLVAFSKVSLALNSVQVSFYIRASQKIAEFEVRRVQQDIRNIAGGQAVEDDTIDDDDVRAARNIAVRVKKLFIDLHRLTNNSHKFFVFFAPTILIHFLMFFEGIFRAQDENECTPYWIFVGSIGPLLTVIIFVHKYALLNLHIERDIDTDLMELGLRVTRGVIRERREGGSESERESNNYSFLIDQLYSLKQIRAHICVLPMDFIPSMEASRGIWKTCFTVFCLVFPYLIYADIMNQEYLCLKN